MPSSRWWPSPGLPRSTDHAASFLVSMHMFLVHQLARWCWSKAAGRRLTKALTERLPAWLAHLHASSLSWPTPGVTSIACGTQGVHAVHQGGAAGLGKAAKHKGSQQLQPLNIKPNTRIRYAALKGPEPT